MENNLKGCVINRQWLEQALDLLPDAAIRCSFYEGLMFAAFGLTPREPSDPTARVMYKMCLPYIEADVDKYAARCERNRLNATKKPLAATRSDSQPLATNGSGEKRQGVNINTNTNTNNNNNTNNNLSTESNEEKERFVIFGVMFNKDCLNITSEVDAFWNYYASLGWRNKNGSPVVNKAACARMWRVGGDLAGAMEWRALWYDCFKGATTTDVRVWTQIKGLKIEGAEGHRNVSILTNGGDDWVELIENQCTAQLRAIMAKTGANTILYRMNK